MDRGSVVARGRQFKVTNSAIKGTLFGVLGSRVPFRKKKKEKQRREKIIDEGETEKKRQNKVHKGDA